MAIAQNIAFFPARQINSNRWIGEFVSQAFIGPISDQHGFHSRRAGRVFASLTDARYSEDPVDANSVECRLHTRGFLVCDTNPTTGQIIAPPVLQLTQSAGRELVTMHGRIGAFCSGYHHEANRQRQRFDLAATQQTDFGCHWHVVVYGQPHWGLAWTFRLGGSRTCRCIWHEIDIQLATSGEDGVSFAVAMPRWSAFPSHRVWVITPAHPSGTEILTRKQDMFSVLWQPAPPPHGWDPRFVRQR